MKTHVRKTICKAVGKLALVAFLVGGNAIADEHHHQHHQKRVLQVENAFATPTFALAKMGAGYFTVKNGSDEDVAITELSVEQDVARLVELHETWFDGEVAKMRRLEMPYVVKAGESVEFVPQGKHLMLIGLNKPLQKGNSFKLTLRFDSGEEQVFDIPVKEKQDAGAQHHHHH